MSEVQEHLECAFAKIFETLDHNHEPLVADLIQHLVKMFGEIMPDGSLARYRIALQNYEDACQDLFGIYPDTQEQAMDKLVKAEGCLIRDLVCIVKKQVS